MGRFFYRKSLWQSKGYQIPKTLDELTALGTQMKKDGITPIGFADKDQWPACGTFDYLEHAHQRLRLPHRADGAPGTVGSTRGREGVRHLEGPAAVPRHRRRARPYLAGLGEAQQNKQAGRMFRAPTRSRRSRPGTSRTSTSSRSPRSTARTAGRARGADRRHDAVEEGGDNQAAPRTSRTAAARGQSLYIATDPSDVAAAKGVAQTKYNAIQKKSGAPISGAKQISQFLDRDSLPAFASNVIEPAMIAFNNRTGSFDGSAGEAPRLKSVYASNS